MAAQCTMSGMAYVRCDDDEVTVYAPWGTALAERGRGQRQAIGSLEAEETGGSMICQWIVSPVRYVDTGSKERYSEYG